MPAAKNSSFPPEKVALYESEKFLKKYNNKLFEAYGAVMRECFRYVVARRAPAINRMTPAAHSTPPTAGESFS